MTYRGGVLRETTPSSMAAPDLNTIPNNCAWGNSLSLSGYGTGILYRRPWFKPCPDLTFLTCIYSFVSLLLTLFVRHFDKYYQLFVLSCCRRFVVVVVVVECYCIYCIDRHCPHLKVVVGGSNLSLLLTLYHTIPIFYDLKEEGFLKTLWEKEKMLVASIFLLFPQCFLPFPKASYKF